MEELLTIKFTHSNTVHERKPYTIYEIEVRSSSTISWVIYKRYSSFDDLFDQLQKFTTSNISVLGPIKLPILPPKRMTRSLASEFVEKRKSELQDFLRSCLQIPSVLHSDIMINFLEVPDSVRPMLSRPNPSKNNQNDKQDKNNTAQTSTTSPTDNNANRFSCHTPEEKQVIDLVTALKSSQNKVAAIRHFETNFFLTQSMASRSRLSAEYIRLLFEGQPDTPSNNGQIVPPLRPGQLPSQQQQQQQNNQSNSIGLVYVCGDFRHSRCAARAALCLIARLCDPERNKDSSLYIDQFASLPSSLLQRMRLQNHIFTTRGNRPAAFAILHTLQQYVESRSNVSSGVGGVGGAHSEITLDFLVQEAWARQEYLKWLKVKNVQHFRKTQTTHEHNTTMSLFLRGNTLAAYRPLIQSGLQQLLNVCSLETGWQEIEFNETTSQFNNNNNTGSGNTTANNNNPPSTPKAQLTPNALNQKQGIFQPSTPRTNVTDNNPGTPQTNRTSPNNPTATSSTSNTNTNLPISLAYQRDNENNTLVLRSCVLLPFSVQKVNAIISVPDLLPLWDTKVHSASVTHQFDISSDILHLVYFTNGSVYSQKDFALLRSVTQLQDGSIIFLLRSVNIPSCAEVKGYQRCTLAPSGYIISPISATETLLTQVLQLDQDSVLLYAADLLGESHEVRTSWNNLVSLLEAVVD